MFLKNGGVMNTKMHQIYSIKNNILIILGEGYRCKFSTTLAEKKKKVLIVDNVQVFAEITSSFQESTL